MSNIKIRNTERTLVHSDTSIAQNERYEYGESTLKDGVVRFFSTVKSYEMVNGVRQQKWVTPNGFDQTSRLWNLILQAASKYASPKGDVITIETLGFRHIYPLLEAIDRVRSIYNVFSHENVSRLRNVMTYETEDDNDGIESKKRQYDIVIHGLQIQLIVDPLKLQVFKDFVQAILPYTYDVDESNKNELEVLSKKL